MLGNTAFCVCNDVVIDDHQDKDCNAQNVGDDALKNLILSLHYPTINLIFISTTFQNLT